MTSRATAHPSADRRRLVGKLLPDNGLQQPRKPHRLPPPRHRPGRAFDTGEVGVQADETVDADSGWARGGKVIVAD